jgi:hypothetical protein
MTRCHQAERVTPGIDGRELGTTRALAFRRPMVDTAWMGQTSSGRLKKRGR